MHRRAFIDWGKRSEIALMRDQVFTPIRAAASRIDWRAAGVTLSVQIGLLAALLSSIITVAPPQASAGNGGISVFSLATAAVAKPTPPKPIDAVRVPPPIVRVNVKTLLVAAEPALTSPSDATLAAGQICDIAALVGSALVTDEDALASLIAIDSVSLPVSRAMVLWDGDWVVPLSPLAPAPPPSASLPAAPLLSPVQQSVIAAVSAAPAACQTEPMAGPQFIMLDGINAGRTIVLVVGSGTWTWDQTLPNIETDNEQGEGEWSSLESDEEKTNTPIA